MPVCRGFDGASGKPRFKKMALSGAVKKGFRGGCVALAGNDLVESPHQVSVRLAVIGPARSAIALKVTGLKLKENSGRGCDGSGDYESGADDSEPGAGARAVAACGGVCGGADTRI